MKARPGDGASVGELDLSVRAANTCYVRGIKTVGELRLQDLAAIGLGAKYHRRSVAEALARWDCEDATRWLAGREELVRRARWTVAQLTAAERKALFRELGTCYCAGALRFAAKDPGAAVGALVGGLFGAAVGAAGTKAKARDDAVKAKP